ncbi:LAFA_0E14488g1_1 [Lachancea sp. 'fantastica']|nr:LAFA_0E14488g1_1 [Lachancea sp. 'fantastica']
MTSRAPYGVVLNERSRREFELLNSLCAVENYGHLLSYLEAQLRRAWLNKAFVVPPADVLIVIMTLAVLPDAELSGSEVKLDPCSVIKASIGSRSLKVLVQFVEILLKKVPDTRIDYNLNLLRCQFFIVLDQLNSPGSQLLFSTRYRDSQKRRKTNSRISLEDTPNYSGTNAESSGFRNPYGSYVSVLEHKPRVLKNIVLTMLLAHGGEFWNSVIWTIYCSISDDSHLYERSKRWTRLLSLIFDLFELRNEYCTKLGLDSNAQESPNYVSPLLNLFCSLNTSDTLTALCDILLLGFDYSTAGAVSVHAVYDKEFTKPATYVTRTVEDRSLRFMESMAFRHRLLLSFTKLIDSLPDHLQSTYQNLSNARFNKTLSRFLSRIENLSQLKHFFCVANLSAFLGTMPHIAQATLNECLVDLEQQREVSLVDSLGGDDTMINELIDLFGSGFPLLDRNDVQPRNTTYTLIEKCDICLLVILRYWEYVHQSSRIKTRQSYQDLLESVHQNDQRRITFARVMNWEEAQLPLLSPQLNKML